MRFFHVTGILGLTLLVLILGEGRFSLVASQAPNAKDTEAFLKEKVERFGHLRTYKEQLQGERVQLGRVASTFVTTMEFSGSRATSQLCSKIVNDRDGLDFQYRWTWGLQQYQAVIDLNAVNARVEVKPDPASGGDGAWVVIECLEKGCVRVKGIFINPVKGNTNTVTDTMRNLQCDVAALTKQLAANDDRLSGDLPALGFQFDKSDSVWAIPISTTAEAERVRKALSHLIKLRGGREKKELF